MNAIDLLKTQINFAHEVVEGTIANVDDAACHNTPGGKAHPIGATYAHTILSEDFIVNMMCRGSTPLMMGEWAGKAGISEPPPMPGQGDMFAWANSVKVDLEQTRKYAQAVYANTLEYVSSLSPEDLDREMDIPGFGKNSLAWFINIATVVHPSNHIGEVSAMKGIQGLQGYPF
jgi:hypothetical protein